jgi:hypothetical protein
VLLVALAVWPIPSAPAAESVPASKVLAIHFQLAAEPKLDPGTTNLHLLIVQRGCGPIYEHARLRWAPRRLTVTMLARPWPHPSGEPVLCPQYIAIRPVTLALGRRLGPRGVYDGSYRPPRPAAVKAEPPA